MKQFICLLLIALAASKSIPELYTSNGGQFTSDYAAKYSSSTTGEFGFSTEAGDINNDGITDFIIADPFYDSNKGIVYVIYGTKGTLRQITTMNDFTSSDGFIIKGAQADQRLGFALGPAGDVNGDGIDDIIIGSLGWRQDSSNTEVGVTYVIFGRKSSSEFPSIVDADRLSSTQGFKMFGEGAKHLSGYSASGAGDINGDGIADIMIGAIFANGEAGKVYVVFGKRSGWEDFKFPPAAGKGFTIEGSGQEHFGNSVSKVGDFNGDGIDDVIIGAHCADTWRGRAYIIYGRTNFPSVMKANDGLIIQGVASYNNFGATVSDIGDFNGDGLKDVAVGAFAANGGRGAAYVVLGSRTNGASISVDSMSSSRGFSVSSSGASSSAQVGLFVTGGRDLNGDGISDFVVSAPGLNNNKGAVYVIYGSQGSSFSSVALDSLSSSKGYVLNGLKEGDRFGTFIKPLKDVNKDGVSDLLVGAYGSNSKKGSAYVFYLPWSCASNCGQCSKPDTCESCSSGYGFLNGACVVCPSTTHQLSNGYCIGKCPANCQSCSSSNTCNACVSGYGFLNGACITCPSTHTLSNGNCVVKCPSNCQSCSSSGTCNACVSGYGFLNGACVTCPSTHTLSNGNCVVKCPSNCQSCDNSGKCISCGYGYGFLDGACVVCPSSTHTLSNGYCRIKCSENCLSCSQPNTCDTCSLGYGFLNGACVTCPSTTHILSNGFCLIKCASNCQSCSKPNTCDTCAQGYGFFNGDCAICPFTHSLSNGACKANCAANCEQCSDANKCDVCIQGYGFLDGKCVACPASTHVLSNGECFIKCSDNCSRCSEPNTCDVCLHGFGFFNDNQCALCPAVTHFENNGYCIEIQDPFKIVKDFFRDLFR